MLIDGDRTIEVLLVEDNAGSARLTTEALLEGSFNIHVTLARDGVDAMERLSHSKANDNQGMPDLILLDLNLPRKNGREVLAEIKSSPDLRQIPVLVMTSSRADEDVARAYSLNANCYIVKPHELSEYVRVIRAIEDFWFFTATFLKRKKLINIGI